MGMRTEKNERRRFKRKTQEENYIIPNFFPPFDLFFHHFDAVFSLISLSFLTTKYGFSQVFYIKEALSMSLTRFRGKCSNLVVERVAKSRVSNSSDSKKSDSGWVGLEFQKVGFRYTKSRVFCRVSCTFYSKFYVLFHKAGFG